MIQMIYIFKFRSLENSKIEFFASCFLKSTSEIVAFPRADIEFGNQVYCFVTFASLLPMFSNDETSTPAIESV